MKFLNMYLDMYLDVYLREEIDIFDYNLLKHSVFFDNIREDPEFKRILNSIEEMYLERYYCIEEVLRRFGEIE